LTVSVIDDTPSVSLDTNNLTVSAGSEISGSFELKTGADEEGSLVVNGESVTEDNTTVYNGDKGILVVNTNGSWTFTAKPNMDGPLSFAFAYTDADGDSVSADLQLSVANPTCPTGLDFTAEVSEAGLASGSNPGILDTGAIILSGLPDNWSIQSATASDGTPLSFSGTGRNWSVTLTGNLAHTPGETKTLAALVTIADKLGNTYENIPLTVSVIDDAPSVSLDTNNLTVPAGSEISGHFDLKTGADANDEALTVDSKPVTTNNTTVYKGDAGILVVDIGGSWTFTANPNMDAGPLSFAFAYTDADGDSVSVDLQLSVAKPTCPTGLDFTAEVSEAGLASGSDPGDLDTGAIRLSGLPDNWSVQSATADDDTPLSFSGADRNWSVTLTDNLAHTSGETKTFDALVTIVDKLGNTYENIPLTVSVIDDAPSMSLDTNNLTVPAGSEISGRFELTTGADASGGTLTVDNRPVTANNTTVYDGDEGILVVGIDGSWTFTSQENAANGAALSFVFEYTDADGDATSQTLAFTLVAPTPGPEPTPTPEPEPGPTPEPEPTPTPGPEPTPTPEPEPTPTPGPGPSPTPGPEPDPTPEPEPTPTPGPGPTPTPGPGPSPTPGPEPTPGPGPSPTPGPGPDPTPGPGPAPMPGPAGMAPGHWSDSLAPLPQSPASSGMGRVGPSLPGSPRSLLEPTLRDELENQPVPQRQPDGASFGAATGSPRGTSRDTHGTSVTSEGTSRQSGTPPNGSQGSPAGAAGTSGQAGPPAGLPTGVKPLDISPLGTPPDDVNPQGDLPERASALNGLSEDDMPQGEQDTPDSPEQGQGDSASGPSSGRGAPGQGSEAQGGQESASAGSEGTEPGGSELEDESDRKKKTAPPIR
jgi:hypothetical protein